MFLLYVYMFTICSCHVVLKVYLLTYLLTYFSAPTSDAPAVQIWWLQVTNAEICAWSDVAFVVTVVAIALSLEVDWIGGSEHVHLVQYLDRGLSEHVRACSQVSGPHSISSMRIWQVLVDLIWQYERSRGNGLLPLYLRSHCIWVPEVSPTCHAIPEVV